MCSLPRARRCSQCLKGAIRRRDCDGYDHIRAFFEVEPFLRYEHAVKKFGLDIPHFIFLVWIAD